LSEWFPSSPPMQNPVVDVHLDSVRSDLQSFKGIRERVKSESSCDGYESDGTLDNVSEIADSESEIESSVSAESLSCSSEYVVNSSHLTDSMTFRERWINENGVQVTVTIRDRELENHLTSV
ncbi:hypothetical protein PENTCL1PPCAC_6017, partial [Pristionchus entomophagus]